MSSRRSQDVDPRIHISAEKANPIITLKVTVPIAPIRRAPRPSAALETEMIYGDAFTVHKLSPGWAWGQAVSPVPGSDLPGYVGYVREKFLTESITDPTHFVTVLSAPVFRTADIKSMVVKTLPLNARLSGEPHGDFLALSSGFIHKKHLGLIGRDFANDFVSAAERLMGRPYIWGGVSARGLDCSGLVQTALRACGSDAPRDSDMQAEIGTPVDITDDFDGLQRGDLVFWKGHVGIMQSSTELLHANAYHMAVASEPLSEAVDRIEKTAGPVTAVRRL